MRRTTLGIVAASILFGSSLVLARTADAATPVEIGPPYASANEDTWCYPEGSPHCKASADADADSGEIELEVEIDVPADHDDFVFGDAKGTMRTDLALTEAAAGVAVRATFHIESAELGFTGLSGSPVSQSTLWGRVDIAHDACTECERQVSSSFFEFALDEEYVEIKNETVVVESRLHNPDGDVPAGTLDISALLSSDSWVWDDDEATTVANANAEMTGFAVIVVGAEPTRESAKPYLGPGGDVFYAHGTGPNCTTTGAEVGGVCFRLEADDELMQFELSDDHTEGPIGGRWQAYDDDEILLGAGDFCGTSERIWVPDGATNVTIFTQTVRGHLQRDCTDPTPATTGTVSATFWG